MASTPLWKVESKQTWVVIEDLAASQRFQSHYKATPQAVEHSNYLQGPDEEEDPEPSRARADRNVRVTAATTPARDPRPSSSGTEPPVTSSLQCAC
jgi:hypothetical protein